MGWRAGSFVRVALVCAFGVLTVTGCETGRTNKNHATDEQVSNVETTGKPQQGYAPTPAQEGQPPVPGSPTAAGPDGRQPLNDNEARPSPGAEKGIASAPRRQPKDNFERQ